MRLLLATAAVCGSLALAACGDDSDEESSPAAAPEAGADATNQAGAQGGGPDAKDDKSAGSAGDGVEIATRDSQFGAVLFDGEDRAIYYFDKEASSESECYGACAEAWPPVLSEGEPRATGGVESKLLGTTRRDDGSTQVTYDGRPLYYYVDDPPGQVLCHNVVEFGALWLAVQPSGEPVA